MKLRFRSRLNFAPCLRFTLLLLLFGILPISDAAAQPANLAVGSAAGAAGSAVLLPVTLTPGAASISTLQFDLEFSSSLSYVSVSTGPAAVSAGKSASANPIPGGVRVLVFGLNQNTIGAGVIAGVRINISAGGSIGLNPVAISGIVASDPSAYAVPTSGSAGAITRLATTDTANPVISGVSSSNVTIGGATITWSTSEYSDSQVQYGPTTSYGSSSALNSAPAMSHSQVLTGLTANTVYHYRVRSRDAAGNLAVSGDFTFTTKASGAAPVISGITVSDVTDRSARISWTTDRESDSEVEYRSEAHPNRRAVLGDLETSHSLALNRLQNSTQYYFRVISTDPDGNRASTPEFTFTTEASGTSALVLPRFSAGESSGQQAAQPAGDVMIGMALTNLGSEAANLVSTAMDSTGNLLAGPDIVNPRSWGLDPRSQFAVLDMEVFGEGFTASDSRGWIKLETASPDVGGFFLTFDAGLSFMDGANFGTAPLTDFAFTEIEPAGSTRINIANPNPDDAVVTFNLMKADGTIRGSQSRTVRGNGALVADLYGDLFFGIGPDPSDYVRMSSTQGVEPFELMQKTVGDISSLTGQDVTAGGTTLYSPQYVLGGPWMTTLSVVNLDSRTGMVTLRFVGEDGVQIGSTRAAAIPGYGKLRIDDPGFFTSLGPDEVAAGYVEIVSDGIRLAGNTVFGDSSGQSFSSALPLIYSLQESVLFSHIASNDLYFTGIAILNPDTADANVEIELYGADGTLLDSRSQVIPAKQRTSRLLTEYFASLVGKDQASGYIRVVSDIPIASFALFGTNNLSVLSAIPPQAIQ